MDNVQAEIDLLRAEMEQTTAVLLKAVRDRKACNKDSPLLADLNAAVEKARESLHAVEVKLRRLYESKEEG